MSTTANDPPINPRALRREIRRAWSRWIRTIAAVRASRRSTRPRAAQAYRVDYQSLWERCRQAERQAGPHGARLYREMLTTLEPFSNLPSLDAADAAILADLERRALVIEKRLGGGWARRRLWRHPRRGLYLVAILIVALCATLRGMNLLGPLMAELNRLWYRMTYPLRGADLVEVTAAAVAAAVLMGLYSAFRTRWY